MTMVYSSVVFRLVNKLQANKLQASLHCQFTLPILGRTCILLILKEREVPRRDLFQ